MGENSAISWTDHTFNPWIGCTKVSPACDGCYAEALMDARLGRVQWGEERARTEPANWRKPLVWNKRAQDEGRSAFVFCASLADVFDNQAPAEWRRDLFDLIRKTPHLTWLLLTKRPGNIVGLYRFAMGLAEPDRSPLGFDAEWPRNAAIGCTVVTQAEADRDIPKLLAAKAALNPAFAFVSMEPLLEAVSLGCIPWLSNRGFMDALTGQTEFPEVAARPHAAPPAPRLDWVITGGETDQGTHKARPSNAAWFRSLRDQCAAAGVAYHHKQNGEWLEIYGDARSHELAARTPFDSDLGIPMFRVGKKAAGRLLDGVTHDARPVL